MLYIFRSVICETRVDKQVRFNEEQKDYYIDKKVHNNEMNKRFLLKYENTDI